MPENAAKLAAAATAAAAAAAAVYAYARMRSSHLHRASDEEIQHVAQSAAHYAAQGAVDDSPPMAERGNRSLVDLGAVIAVPRSAPDLKSVIERNSEQVMAWFPRFFSMQSRVSQHLGGPKRKEPKRKDPKRKEPEVTVMLPPPSLAPPNAHTGQPSHHLSSPASNPLTHRPTLTSISTPTLAAHHLRRSFFHPAS